MLEIDFKVWFDFKKIMNSVEVIEEQGGDYPSLILTGGSPIVLASLGYLKLCSLVIVRGDEESRKEVEGFKTRVRVWDGGRAIHEECEMGSEKGLRSIKG